MHIRPVTRLRDVGPSRPGQSGTGRRARQGAGFSLIELMIVLALLALGSSLVAARIGAGGDRVALRSSAREVVAVLADARRLARMTGRVQVIRAGEGDVLVQDPGGQQIRLRAAHLAASDRIVFLPGGGSSGGSVRLARAGREMHLTVEPFLGSIAVREVPGD